MNEHEPSRGAEPWSSAPAAVRDALAAARADLPPSARLAQVAAALPAMYPAFGQAASAAPVEAATPSALSGALVGAALGVLVSGAAFLGSSQTEQTRNVGAAPTARVIEAVAPTEASARSASPAVKEARDRRPIASAVTSASIARPTPPPSAAAPSASAAEGGGPPPPSSLSGRALAPDDTETEAHLLERAQDALASSPAQALALAEQHAARFARGGLGQEREVVAIQALLGLGRPEDARARADRLLAAHPGSAYRPRIEALLRR